MMDIVEGVVSGNSRAVARAITLVENEHDDKELEGFESRE